MRDIVLDVYLRSLVLGSLFWVASAAITKRSASFRHAMTIASLAVLLALPGLRLVIPGRELAWLPATGPVTESPVTHPYVPPMIQLKLDHLSTSGTNKRPTDGWLLLLFVGPAVLLLRYGIGIAVLRKWAQAGEPAGESRIYCPVVVTGMVGMPLAAWIGRNVILVPTAWETWTLARREAVLRHESAHLRRGDLVSQFLAQLTCSVYWANPFVWLLARQSRDLAEQAADDAVLANGGDRHGYAQDLLDIAREKRATFPVPAISMANESQVARRIRMVLNPNMERGVVTAPTLVIASLLICTVATPFASVRLTKKVLRTETSAPAASARVPAQYIIKFTVLKDPIPLSSITSEKTGKAMSSPAHYQAIAMISSEQEKSLIKSWGHSKQIISSPTIRTVSGEDAKITGSGKEWTLTLQITPTYVNAANSTVKLHFSRQVENSVNSTDTAFTMQTPGSALIIVPDQAHSSPTVIGVLDMTVVDGPITP